MLGEDSVDHMERRLAKKGRPGYAKLVKPVKPPTELAYLLLWYLELRGGMPRGLYMEPLSHTEILAYRTLHEGVVDMNSFDVGMLRELDTIYIKVQPKPEPDRTRRRRA